MAGVTVYTKVTLIAGIQAFLRIVRREMSMAQCHKPCGWLNAESILGEEKSPVPCFVQFNKAETVVSQ